MLKWRDDWTWICKAGLFNVCCSIEAGLFTFCTRCYQIIATQKDTSRTLELTNRGGTETRTETRLDVDVLRAS
jgi:hypothetical protein